MTRFSQLSGLRSQHQQFGASAQDFQFLFFKSEAQAAGQLQGGAEEKMVGVITSYSIHYTKLYDSMDIAAQAELEGISDLRKSGLRKVKAGMTSLTEVLATTNE